MLVQNPGKYYSRKGCFAINVQVIIDKQKWVLWCHTGEMGSSHDSPIFHESKLGKYMQENAEDLKKRGLFLVADSAYSLRSYLMTPYDNPGVRSSQDNFNFFLSSCRIYVECCFGEVDRRWGIFWRPLVGKLSNHKNTIDACLRLHNFIVDFREDKLARAARNKRANNRESLTSITRRWPCRKSISWTLHLTARITVQPSIGDSAILLQEHRLGCVGLECSHHR